MSGNRSNHRDDNSRSSLRNDDSRMESARNDFSRSDNDAFGGSSRSGRGGSWSNRNDDDSFRGSSRPGSSGDGDLYDRMERGGSNTSAYGDEQSQSRDRYRNASTNRDSQSDRSMSGSNSDMGADSWGGSSDRDTGRDRYSTRDNARDDYYGNRSSNEDRDHQNNRSSGGSSGGGSYGGSDYGQRDFARDSSGRQASYGNNQPRNDDPYRGDRYSGREGGSNQFSSWRSEPSDTRSSQPWGAAQSSMRSDTNSDMQRGTHAGRGPKGYRRDDNRITEDVNERLTHDPHIDASDIEVSVSNGEVTLSGTVTSRDAKRHAEDLVEMVSGVSDVNNQIRVQKPSMNTSGRSDTDSDATGASASGRNTAVTDKADKNSPRNASGAAPDAAMSHQAGTGPSGAANTSVTSNNPSGKTSPNTSGASTQRTGDKGSHG